MREVLLVGGGGGALCEDILVVNDFKSVFNIQFVVSKHDHNQQSQQKLETKFNRSCIKGK